MIFENFINEAEELLEYMSQDKLDKYRKRTDMYSKFSTGKTAVNKFSAVKAKNMKNRLAQRDEIKDQLRRQWALKQKPAE